VNDSAAALLLLLMLVLPVSALLVRRLPLGRVVRFAVIWAAIFAIVTGAVLLVSS